MHRREIASFFLALYAIQPPVFSRDEDRRPSPARIGFGLGVKLCEHWLADGSAQHDLWGINLYPGLPDEDWIEFDSMINLRPSFGNRSRGIDDPDTRRRVTDLIRRLVVR